MIETLKCISLQKYKVIKMPIKNNHNKINSKYKIQHNTIKDLTTDPKSKKRKKIQKKSKIKEKKNTNKKYPLPIATVPQTKPVQTTYIPSPTNCQSKQKH